MSQSSAPSLDDAASSHQIIFSINSVDKDVTNQANPIPPSSSSSENDPSSKDQVISRPSPSTNITSTALQTLPTSNALSGFSVKYTWRNIPMEVLVEIFKYLDQNTLSSSSLVSREWYHSSKHDLLWYDNCVELFKKIYSEQIDYYVSERQRIGYMKTYGTPIPPPPKKPLVEDYVTFDNDNKIISIGTLRNLHIKHGKKQYKERKRIAKEKRIRQIKEKYHNKLRNHTKPFIITSTSLLYAGFLLFFIMTGITDAVDPPIFNAIGVRWQIFSFIPLWFTFAVAFLITTYFTCLDCLREFREGFWLIAVLMKGLIASFLIVAVLTFINLLLPFTEKTLPNGMVTRTYVISWFYVLIIPYLYFLVVIFAVPIGSCIFATRIFKDDRPKFPLYLWYITGVNFLAFLLESFVVMLGFGLEFAESGFYLMYAAIPFELFFIIGFFTFMHYMIKKIRESTGVSFIGTDAEILLWFMIFSGLLFVNVAVVSFSPFLGHYTWFSSLPPLTCAFAFTIRTVRK
ncbi:hypothetical protein C9374_004334 [Naegleria lovaniensis]|uniref:F-box domain-containing protein n=1 Tax=Naegleria lovaniensis TaxID=51637 RepID=A0AA88GSI7_NAELO|nr:uncharacterized protein C9374_004334 [Naegleria lovaniensis]KAG2383663.1 hypothetical protein C9374_004334 [Naegleria lovaniensis]